MDQGKLRTAKLRERREWRSEEEEEEN